MALLWREAAGATFDPDRLYRYALHRQWGRGPTALWIMLNPSTADEHVLDPTLRRVEAFTRRADVALDGFDVVNLYAYRTRSPKTLWQSAICGMDIVGDETDDHVRAAIARAGRIIVGWGRHPWAADRVRVMQGLLGRQPVWCLGCNQDGSPKHPLYLAATTPLVRWSRDQTPT